MLFVAEDIKLIANLIGGWLELRDIGEILGKLWRIEGGKANSGEV